MAHYYIDHAPESVMYVLRDDKGNVVMEVNLDRVPDTRIGIYHTQKMLKTEPMTIGLDIDEVKWLIDRLKDIVNLAKSEDNE